MRRAAPASDLRQVPTFRASRTPRATTVRVQPRPSILMSARIFDDRHARLSVARLAHARASAFQSMSRRSTRGASGFCANRLTKIEYERKSSAIWSTAGHLTKAVKEPGSFGGPPQSIPTARGSRRSLDPGSRSRFALGAAEKRASPVAGVQARLAHTQPLERFAVSTLWKWCPTLRRCFRPAPSSSRRIVGRNGSRSALKHSLPSTTRETLSR
jgi:hypothetical protein